MKSGRHEIQQLVELVDYFTLILLSVDRKVERVSARSWSAQFMDGSAAKNLELATGFYYKNYFKDYQWVILILVTTIRYLFY